MRNPKLKILEDRFTIYKLSTGSEVPAQVYQSPFFSIVNTDEEVSVVCSSLIPLQAEKSDDGWSCIKMPGPLDLSMTGILAGISAVLAKSEISIFAVSTYDTDYIFVKTSELSGAKRALIASGYTFEE